MSGLRKTLALMAAAFLILGFGGITGARATDYGTNITIYDTLGSGAVGTWYNRGNPGAPPAGGGEDQEVEPNNNTGQIWDLEGFYLTATKLTMVSGYPFKTGYEGYATGDIFISSGTPIYGTGAQGSGSNSTINNIFGYDYVIQLDFSNNTYKVYTIGPTAQIRTVQYSQNAGANPWIYVSGGTLADSGSLDYSGALNDTQVNGNITSGPALQGGYHYAVTVDLAHLLHDGTYFFHYTYECGNDLLMGNGTITGSQVPLLPSALLLGTGLMALVGLGWYRRQS